MGSTKAVVPGDTLYEAKEGYECGRGVYELKGFIRAARVGYVFVKEQTLSGANKPTKLVEVLNYDGSFTYYAPFIGALVTAKVVEIGDKSAKCSVFRIQETNLQPGATFTAYIRKEDMRSDMKLDRDKFEDSVHSKKVCIIRLSNSSSFVRDVVLPGDYVIATVKSMGDSHYLLTIADSRLGVVAVRSRNGNSWVQPTGNNPSFPRKVALIPNTVPKLDSVAVSTA